MTGELGLPAGFRFHPTDEELVMHYLCRRCASQPIAVPVIAEIDLYKYDPWQLPGMALYGEKEWYFFSPRDRKYPNGSRPNRTAGTGYWKATGTDKPIGPSKAVGIKKALVFYTGKAPKGEKTNWIMHEYRLANVDRSARKKGLRLDDWVLCRIYNRKGSIENKLTSVRKSVVYSEIEDQKPEFMTQDRNILAPIPEASPAINNFFYVDTSDSIPGLRTDSSSSEHVVSSDKDVSSEPQWRDWNNTFDYSFNNMNAIEDNLFGQVHSNQLSPLNDMFNYLQEPFL
ncbi:hypothetical protein HHK36_007779 [Tetracentron sinense]|uniref:NAC domain-containing protein n=1 Tax=Tetracentron sinense TaxID=13715 RepID=A0A834ZF83_TETSI|nr:hypothetical protein HHK36_007779 [Tetracentron sinense]